MLRRFLSSADPQKTYLCDNGNRPLFWPRPALLEKAERAGFKVLAGSDPLHFASEMRRTGTYVSALPGRLSAEQPVAQLRQLLADPSLAVHTLGRLESPGRFLRNQFAMQMLKKKNRKALLRS